MLKIRNNQSKAVEDPNPLMTSYGELRNLGDFAFYASEESTEAARLFRSKDFRRLLPENDKVLSALWRGLTKPPSGKLQMEEFLTAAGLKEAVKLSLDEEGASYQEITDSQGERFAVRRSAKGCVQFTVKSDSDFIILQKDTYTEDDFTGSICDVEYGLDVSKMGRTERRGVITVSSLTGELKYAVRASLKSGIRSSHSDQNRFGRDLLKSRLMYVLGRTDKSLYVLESLNLISERYEMSTGKLGLYRLYQAYLEELRGNRKDALAILREFREERFTEEEYEERAAWLYLSGLLGIRKETAKETAEEIRDLYLRHDDSYLMMKLLFLTNPDIGHYPGRKRVFERRLYEGGCRSPLLYAEVLKDLQDADELLDELTPLNLQVLSFATRYGLMNRVLTLRTAYLSDHVKHYSPLLFRVLSKAYSTWPLDGILEAMIRLLMKGDPADTRNFRWYERAVKRNIRVIRLYEYYIETMPQGRNDILPASVRKYFLYNSTLSEAGTARVYANIVRHREEDPDTFEAYRERVENFAYSGLRKGIVTADHAILYQELIGHIPDDASANTYAHAAFAEKITVGDDRFRTVVVLHDELSEESKTRLVKGEACIFRYNNKAQIFFENAQGQRVSARGRSWISEELMNRRQALQKLKKSEITDEGLLLIRAEEAKKKKDARSRGLFLRLIEDQRFTEEYRLDTARCLLEMWSEDSIPPLFAGGEPEKRTEFFFRADPGLTIRALAEEGLYQRAFELIQTYGSEGVPKELMVRIAGRLADDAGESEDEELTAFAMGIVRSGISEERILKYLVRHFKGSMDDMRLLRREAAAFYVDTWLLDDRILMRLVSGGQDIPESTEILKSYVKRGGRRGLIRSFLKMKARKLCAEEEETDPFLVTMYMEAEEEGDDTDLAMKLVLLRALSSKESLNTYETEIAEKLMEECASEDIFLPFMKKLPHKITARWRISDKTFITVKADEKDSVTVRYHFLKNGISGPVKSESMKHVFGGLFVRGFTLLYGEELYYQAEIRHDGTETVQDEQHISSDSEWERGTDGFKRLNRMLKAREEGESECLKEELKDYMRSRYVAEALFPAGSF
ncbi:MAG: hypothetical protein J6D14_03660 [Lachnospiraceae bacterium]|nr:hypothetical protein [Lachnospiraceae bacterium]